MENNTFKAMLVKEIGEGRFQREIVTRNISDLPDGDVLIKVNYSSLNFKDALSASGNKGVTRNYPHTPGIDAAGIVVESNDSNLKAGEQVIVTGYDLGMNTFGGFGEYIRVPSSWVVKLPKNLTLKESMILGTAGFTAALSVHKLINSDIKPSDGNILVTGATGGVGSIAVALLSRLGYKVFAATGKTSERDMLLSIGAVDIVDRKEMESQTAKPLLKGKWAGVIDTVGGNILAAAIKSTSYGGTVTCCGNVASHEFSVSIYPFILRGVSLLGVDSVECPMDLRIKLWHKLSEACKPDNFGLNVTEVSLEGLNERIDMMLKGNHKGRTLIRC